MNKDQYYEELSNFIDANFDGVSEVLSEFNSKHEPSPEALIIANHAFPGTFAEALASRTSEYLGVDGKTQKPDKLGKILDGATGLLLAVKGIRDFSKNGKKQEPEEQSVVVQPENKEQPKAKIMGLPKGLFILGSVTLALLAIFFGLKFLKK